MQQIKSNLPKQDIPTNGDSEQEDQTVVTEAVETPASSPGKTKIPATEEQFLAVQLHQAREDKNLLRKQLRAQQKMIADLQTQAAALRQQLLDTEIAADDKANAELRADHAFEVGASITKDETTGEVFWIK